MTGRIGRLRRRVNSPEGGTATTERGAAAPAETTAWLKPPAGARSSAVPRGIPGGVLGASRGRPGLPAAAAVLGSPPALYNP